MWHKFKGVHACVHVQEHSALNCKPCHTHVEIDDIEFKIIVEYLVQYLAFFGWVGEREPGSTALPWTIEEIKQWTIVSLSLAHTPQPSTSLYSIHQYLNSYKCHMLACYKLTPVSEELGVCPAGLLWADPPPPPPPFLVWGEFLAWNFFSYIHRYSLTRRAVSDYRKSSLTFFLAKASFSFLSIATADQTSNASAPRYFSSILRTAYWKFVYLEKSISFSNFRTFGRIIREDPNCTTACLFCCNYDRYDPAFRDVYSLSRRADDFSRRATYRPWLRASWSADILTRSSPRNYCDSSPSSNRMASTLDWWAGSFVICCWEIHRKTSILRRTALQTRW